ncbi:MAG: hypothetical protein WBM03_04735 [Steroidobacteraceae bacterium]
MPQALAIGTKSFEAACSFVLWNVLTARQRVASACAHAPSADPAFRFRPKRMNGDARRPVKALKSKRIRDIVHRALPATRSGDEADRVAVIAI